MSCSRIANYTFREGKLDEAVAKAEEGLLPLFQRHEGFRSYSASKVGEDRVISFSLWDTREQAEAANRIAGEWTQENLGHLADTAEVMLGDVLFLAEEMTGPADLISDLVDAFNERDLERMMPSIAAGATMRNAALGLELPIREDMETWITAFPDGQMEVTNIVASGDTVILEFIGRGTHMGVLKGADGSLEPTGRYVEMPFVESYDIRNGRIVGGRTYFDSAQMLRQLGVEPLQEGVSAPREAVTEQQVPTQH